MAITRRTGTPFEPLATPAEPQSSANLDDPAAEENPLSTEIAAPCTTN